MFSSLLSVGVLLLQASQVVFSSRTRCSTFTLRHSSVKAVVANTTFFEANDTVAITNPFSSIDVNDLPAFCRVVLAITTNATAGSTAHAEIWLPEPHSWNGRFLGFGNGGFGGGGKQTHTRYFLLKSYIERAAVNVADLGFVAITQGCEIAPQHCREPSRNFVNFQVAGMSTDTGHLSNSGDGSWAGPHNDVRSYFPDNLASSHCRNPERNHRLELARFAPQYCGGEEGSATVLW